MTRVSPGGSHGEGVRIALLCSNSKHPPRSSGARLLRGARYVTRTRTMGYTYDSLSTIHTPEFFASAHLFPMQGRAALRARSIRRPGRRERAGHRATQAESDDPAHWQAALLVRLDDCTANAE